MRSDNDTPPSPLTAAEVLEIAALNWSFALGPPGAMACLPKPALRDTPLYLLAYEVISKEPLLCNHGLALLQPGTPGQTEQLPRHLIPPPGYTLAGIAAARRAGTGPHPFAQHFPASYRRQRQALAQLITQGEPLPEDAPRLMLRCLLREMVASQPARIMALAETYDRPLWRALGGVAG